MAIIGIRREDKSVWERRAPLVPADVAELVSTHGVDVRVQSAERRCFSDDEYRRAGAVVADDLRDADVILGVKEIPLDSLEAGKTYLFFSHTMKGQSYNMPMLQRLLELGCTLLDYELVQDDSGVRTIAFGRYAGLAGAIDTLWALGKRLALRGFETPLLGVQQAIEYGDIAAARAAIEEAGRRIARDGLPAEISPLVIGVTGGGGKVSGGALEILDLLPSRRVDPDELATVIDGCEAGGREVLVASYAPGHLVEPVDASARYSWDDYLQHPGAYRSRFAPHLALLSALVHGIYWEEGYPRFVLRQDLAPLWANGQRPKLEVITDITCDPDGSNESLVRITDPGDPVYVYDPATGSAVDGWEGPGPAVLPVEIFPAEIPRDSSEHFSRMLSPLVPALARAGRNLDAGDESVPAALRGSLLAVRGKLLPRWEEELSKPLGQHGSGAAS